MFGTNPVRKLDRSDGMSLSVHSVFATIQGEGPLAGMPAVFVRLAGCGLACHFCDTEFEQGARHIKLDELFQTIEDERRKVHTDLIVVTGGEPLRQNVVPFVARCGGRDLDVQFETAGYCWPAGLEDLMANVTIVCSPKVGKLHAKVIEHCRHWKYVVAAGDESPEDGLPVQSTQAPGYVRRSPARPPLDERNTIWVSPCAEYKHFGRDIYGGLVTSRSVPDDERTRTNMDHAARIAMKYGYRLNLQQHKILNLP